MMKKLKALNQSRIVTAFVLVFSMLLSISIMNKLTTNVDAATSAYNQIAASSYSSQSGIDMEACSEGGQNIAFIDNNDYIVFNSVDFGSGATSFEARVASNANGGNIEVRLDSPTGTLVGTCAVANTGNWQNWVTKSCTISGATGVHNLYLKFTGGAGNLFNLNWFKFYTGKSAFTQIAASSYDNQFGIQKEGCSEGGENVAFVDNNDYIVFNNINFGSGASSFEARVASAANGGNIEIRLDSATGTLVGTCSVTNTGDWQNWVTKSCSVNGATGVHTLYLKFTGGTGNLFNINWFKFSTSSTPTPTPTPTPTTGDVVGHLFAGYQGWFNCAGDNSPLGGWNHWSGSGLPTPNNTNFELYPDMREYTATYATGYANFGNGQQAKLFSSYDQSTVNKHFEWMKTYNIDGAALQRFGASGPMDGWKQNRDSVAVKVKNAAETYGRKFYVMYDITGMPTSTWHTDIQNDWTTNVLGSMNLTSSSAYAKQNGKPVVCIWGIGFTDRPGDATQCATLINWFKNQGYYVIGGVPTYWRTGNNDSRSGFENIYKSLDMISPWSVARFNNNDLSSFTTNQWQQDFTYCNQNNIAYQPVMWPGSAWSNLQKHRGVIAPKNENPRFHGDFMWKQAYGLKNIGISTGYIAMFDEYDEGTAIAKIAENSSMIPTNEYFLTLDVDGVACSSDFYLRLAGDINRLFKGQIPLTTAHPTSHQ
ncbi:MAG: hypothetical protein K0S47_1459 [Herbinix sp.]|jgi:hypothetical protein|nr:hypothetical protein [Herbinix sp.]